MPSIVSNQESTFTTVTTRGDASEHASTATSALTASSASRRHVNSTTVDIDPSLVHGRCKCSGYKYENGCCEGTAYCDGNGFHCERDVCIDRRTPAQKEADKQEAANGRNGRCLYSSSDKTYSCPQRGFFCVNETRCEDWRTPEQKAEDTKAAELAKTQREAKKKTDGIIAGSVVGGTFGSVILLLLGRCCWRSRSLKPQRRRDDRAHELSERNAYHEARRATPEEQDAKAKLELLQAVVRNYNDMPSNDPRKEELFVGLMETAGVSGLTKTTGPPPYLLENVGRQA